MFSELQLSFKGSPDTLWDIALQVRLVEAALRWGQMAPTFCQDLTLPLFLSLLSFPLCVVGNLLPADGMLIQENDLQIDESSLLRNQIMSRNPWNQTPCQSQVWPMATPVPTLPPSQTAKPQRPGPEPAFSSGPAPSPYRFNQKQESISGLNVRKLGNLKEVLYEASTIGTLKELCWNGGDRMREKETNPQAVRRIFSLPPNLLGLF